MISVKSPPIFCRFWYFSFSPPGSWLGLPVFPHPWGPFFPLEALRTRVQDFGFRSPTSDVISAISSLPFHSAQNSWIFVGNQMKRTISVPSDRNIWDHHLGVKFFEFQMLVKLDVRWHLKKGTIYPKPFWSLFVWIRHRNGKTHYMPGPDFFRRRKKSTAPGGKRTYPSHVPAPSRGLY